MGTGIIYRKGFNNTGVKEILGASGILKGSFYLYFMNREDLGLQVNDYFGGFFLEKMAHAMKEESPSPQRMPRLFLFISGVFQGNSFYRRLSFR